MGFFQIWICASQSEEGLAQSLAGTVQELKNISATFLKLKVHNIENFLASDFEFRVISLLIMLKY